MRLLSVMLGCLAVATTCPAQTPKWTERKPISSPSAPWSHGLAYDVVRGRIVLFGGQNSSLVHLNDT